MANRFYGVDQYENSATVAAATTGKSVELVVNDAVGLKKKDVIIALEEIIQAVTEDTGGTYTV